MKYPALQEESSKSLCVTTLTLTARAQDFPPIAQNKICNYLPQCYCIIYVYCFNYIATKVCKKKRPN
ncbi:hypothetical protein FKM82_007190 [Ascaphus truei]